MERVLIWITKELKEELRARAADQGRSMSKHMTHLLKEDLEKAKSKSK